MELMERAARALCRHEGHPENIKFEGRKMWESYVPAVRVVIQAIRKPSLDMSRAGEKLLADHRMHSVSHTDMADSWAVMVDALLNKGVSG